MRVYDLLDWGIPYLDYNDTKGRPYALNPDVALGQFLTFLNDADAVGQLLQHKGIPHQIVDGPEEEGPMFRLFKIIF